MSFMEEMASNGSEVYGHHQKRRTSLSKLIHNQIPEEEVGDVEEEIIDRRIIIEISTKQKRLKLQRKQMNLALLRHQMWYPIINKLTVQRYSVEYVARHDVSKG